MTSDNSTFFGVFGSSADKADTNQNTPADNKTETEARRNKAKKKPCRVCDSFKSWRKAEAKSQTKDQNAKNKSTATMAAAAAVGTAAAANVVTSDNSSIVSSSTLADDECPPDSQVLGRATWTFLHTMAAYYPEKADQGQQELMKTLLTSFSHFYPCGRCASHLREEMKKYPPPVETRESLSQWMCRTHNKVNVVLGKEEFDCSKVDERWRDGPKDGSCSWAQDVEY